MEGLEQAGTQSSMLRVVDTCVNQATDILNLPAMDISGAELKPDCYDLRAEDIHFSYGEKKNHKRYHSEHPGADNDSYCWTLWWR